MQLWKRAYLYVSRRKRKSLLLFITVLLLSSCGTVGLLLGSAADLASKQTRESLKGAFRLSPDMQNRENITVEECNGQTSIRYIGEPLNRNVAEAIQMTQEISGYNAVIRENVMLQEEISLVDYNKKYLDDPVAMHMISMEAHVESTHAVDFQKERLCLTQGEPIAAGDQYAAVISEKLALQNHLEIGEQIRLSPCEGHGGQEILVTVKGLFEVRKEQRDTDAAAPVSLLENRIFIDITSGGLLTGAAGADYMEFFVDDPARVENMIEDIRQIRDTEWENFVFTPEIDEYEKIAAPLADTVFLADILLTMTAVMSMASLSLIQILFLKGRQQETGILLSVGISKTQIIMQHFVEMVTVAFFSFSLSFVLCFSFWNEIGRILYSMAAFRLDVKIDMLLISETVLIIFGCGLTVLFLSVLLSDIWLMRLRPGKIFSKLR